MKGIIKVSLLAVQALLSFTLSWSIANAENLNIKALPNTKFLSTTGKAFPVQGRVALTGPLANAGIGKMLMRAEVVPPTITRGAGGADLERLFASRCRSVVLVIAVEQKGEEWVSTEIFQ